jgi:hypothetical protein
LLGHRPTAEDTQRRYNLGEFKEELMEAMGLNTEGEGSAMAFLRRGYKVGPRPVMFFLGAAGRLPCWLRVVGVRGQKECGELGHVTKGCCHRTCMGTAIGRRA